MKTNILLLTTTLLLTSTLSGCITELREQINPPEPTTPQDYITDKKYTKLIIEIDYTTGNKPSQQALTLLQQNLNQLIKKDTIEIKLNQQLPSTQETYTEGDLITLHHKYQDHTNTDNTVTAHILYLNGQLQDEKGNNALGVALNGNVIAIMHEHLKNSCNITEFCFYQTYEIEQSVLSHEFGHLLGLVNHGTPMVTNHEDPEHKGHSSNEESIMYWALDFTFGIPQLRTLPTTFDQYDKQDICHAGGKCP